jgi:RNA polymerase sigma-70 factor (ECF subfamily)
LETDLQEKALLQRAHQLDKEAFGMIYDAYYDALYRYLYHHLGHVETAEDLASEVFIRLVRRVQEGRGPCHHLRAWLYRVAHNLAMDELRSSARRAFQPLDENLAAGGEEPHDAAQSSIWQEQARAALGRLTPRQRAVVVLKYLEGRPNNEIALMLDITPQGVKKLNQRALAAMRTVLENGLVWTGEAA